MQRMTVDQMPLALLPTYTALSRVKQLHIWKTSQEEQAMTIDLPQTHPELGKPSNIYPYRDANGKIYAAAYRFELKDGKTFRPYDAIQKTWSFPENPDPYIPKNLENLEIRENQENLENQDNSGSKNPEILENLENLEYSDNPVIIVEGEKCADSLRSFGFFGITSFGGSGSAHKTNWSCLKDKNVIIWPDNDEPSLKYAEALKVMLRKVGIKSLRICNVSPSTLRNILHSTLLKEPALKQNLLKQVGSVLLKQTLLKEQNEELLKEVDNPLTSIENLPKGWDVADAINEGWTKEHIQAFLDDAISIEINNVSIETPANDNWGKPDLSFLYRKNEPPKFPIETFSPPIANWLLKTAEGKSAPVDYVAGTLLSASAALIGNSRKVSPWETWAEPCILWIALVGDPSSGKSPAMDPVQDIVKKIEADEVPEYEEALRQYETDKLEAELEKANWQKDLKEHTGNGFAAPLMPQSAIEPDIPQRPRLIIRDATTEALSLALQAQPKGLLMHRDELAGWFASFDRYNSGKGGDRAFWLECFGGKAFTQDRVKNGANPITIQNLSSSIIGSIQPDRLQSLLMKGDDDGLNSRFLYFYPNKVERKRPSHMVDNRNIERALRKLHGLSMDMDDNHKPMQRVIGLSDDASNVFEDWWRNQGKNTPEGKSSGWHGKLAGLSLRIALVLAYLEWASEYDAPEPFEVTYLHISRAMYLIDSYLTPMAERAFGTTAKTEADQNVIILANWILETQPKRIVVRDIQRGSLFPSAVNAETIKQACLQLTALNWLQPDFVRNGYNVGKKQIAFLVSPNLLNSPDISDIRY